MSTTTVAPSARRRPRELAVSFPAASRVFHRHGLDFCCHGRRPLVDACVEAGLDARRRDRRDRRGAGAAAGPAALGREADRRARRPHRRLLPPAPARGAARARGAGRQGGEPPRRKGELPARPARAPRSGARRRARAPREGGAGALPDDPAAGRGRTVARVDQAMESEHDDHAHEPARDAPADGRPRAPEEACASWRALYLRLGAFEAELMDHIHLENNVLFRRVLAR